MVCVLAAGCSHLQRRGHTPDYERAHSVGHPTHDASLVLLKHTLEDRCKGGQRRGGEEGQAARRLVPGTARLCALHVDSLDDCHSAGEHVNDHESDEACRPGPAHRGAAAKSPRMFNQFN